MSELTLKCVKDLLTFDFIIPDYQRGYKWSETEVKYLLEDINDYFKLHTEPKNFYCLQPLVVCKSKDFPNKWEVIDGQQRLTTIYLILNQLKPYMRNKKNYSIEYITRPGSKDYLANLEKTKANDNIDYYHLYNANNMITSFLDSHNYINLLNHFTSNNEDGSNVRFIWYDVTDEINEGKIKPIDIFTRLNIGKIPLTNAELIKALFLSKTNIKRSEETAKEIQSKIALDWDRIEKKLHQEDFWYFIYGNTYYEYSTRIEFLFDIIQKNYHDDDKEIRYTFNKYYDLFSQNINNDNINSVNLWEEVLNIFNIFENWYENRMLYHLIGYNTAIGIPVYKLLELLNKKSKSNTDFNKNLLQNAIKSIDIGTKYGDDATKQTLLLFNILSILKNDKSEERFPFHFYHTQSWDIEHVSPQTNQDITGTDRKNWLITNLSYFTGCPLKYCDESISYAEEHLPTNPEELSITNKLLDFYKDKKDNHEKNTKTLEIMNDLKELFYGNNENKPINDSEKDDISNLVLLDSSTNRMYKNAFYPVKRKWIIKRAKEGIYIPLGTKNVFLKAYSNNFSNLSDWTVNDAKAYEQEISNVIDYFRE